MAGPALSCDLASPRGDQPQAQSSHVQSSQLQTLLSAHWQSPHAQSSHAQAAAQEPQSQSSQAQSSHLQTPQQQPSSVWLTVVVDEPQHQASQELGISPAVEARLTVMIKLKIRLMKVLRANAAWRTLESRQTSFAHPRWARAGTKTEDAPRAAERRRGCTWDHSREMWINYSRRREVRGLDEQHDR